ncbi:hypothetical protein [Pseudomonas sp.]|uniref:hypothetical protein n=1 Tax=Pseudomonas sp. TaxID=306 RepID=UPI0028ACBB12|nr:hypothetical protein [Pseudomonas sp.]
MSLHQLHLTATDPAAEGALASLQHWARERPTQIALRHRRLGIWKAWRWIDVQREVEHVADGLRQQGFTAGARLALSGAFEPTLLIVALAARQIGGHLQMIDRHGQGDILQWQLSQARPTFAYVQCRESVANWLGSGLTEQWPLRVFSAQASAMAQGLWQVEPLSALFVAQAAPAQRQGWAQVAADDVLWVDEGTEWQDGLSHVLQRWLGQGEGLAFPETSESASRDRREITPTDLLLSPRRVEALAAEIESRLAPPGSWRRQACDWALANQQRAVGRWLKARVRRLLGFARLRRIEVASAPPTAVLARPAAWLHEYLERAA